MVVEIDPQKALHAACAIDQRETDLAELVVRSGPRQVDQLLAWARPFDARTWAIESAAGLGYLLAQQLVAHGEVVVDVPATQLRRRLANNAGVTVVEVKSMTGTNQASQIRLGPGQVLDYQYEIEAVGGAGQARAVLALETRPDTDRWISLGGRHGVELIWPETVTTAFDSCRPERQCSRACREMA